MTGDCDGDEDGDRDCCTRQDSNSNGSIYRTTESILLYNLHTLGHSQLLESKTTIRSIVERTQRNYKHTRFLSSSK